MNKYLKKQIIIVLVYLILIVTIGTGIYFLFIKSKLPNCADSIQNQGEAGVDCGGPCSLCPWQLQKDLEIIFAEALKTNDNFVDLVAKIKNPNRDFGVKSLSYKFNLYGSGDDLIVAKQGGSYILPNETGYIIEQKVSVSSDISRVEFRITGIIWQKLVDYEEPELLIRNSQSRQTENGYQINGTLENRGNYDFNKVDIYTVLFDKNSKILGVGQTNERTVLSKENRYFEINWFFPVAGQVKKTDIFTKTNVFLDENFMKRHGEGEKFQEY